MNIEKLKTFVKSYYDAKDPGHNFSHIERILKYTSIIKKDFKNININKLYFLALFHGLNKKINSNENFKKEIVILLKKCNIPDKEINDYFISLSRHIKNPLTIEEKIIHDANFLELYGALGIAKAFITGGFKNQTLDETINIFENNYFKKIKLKTNTGKRLSRDKKCFTKMFLKNLKKELND